MPHQRGWELGSMPSMKFGCRGLHDFGRPQVSPNELGNRPGFECYVRPWRDSWRDTTGLEVVATGLGVVATGFPRGATGSGCASDRLRPVGSVRLRPWQPYLIPRRSEMLLVLCGHWGSGLFPRPASPPPAGTSWPRADRCCTPTMNRPIVTRVVTQFNRHYATPIGFNPEVPTPPPEPSNPSIAERGNPSPCE